MNCPNCGASNIDNSSFCVECGAKLTEPQPHQTNNVVNPTVQNINQTSKPNIQSEINVQNPVQDNSIGKVSNESNQSNTVNNTANPVNNVNSASNSAAKSVSLNYFMYIIAILLRPFKCFKEEEGKMSDIKNSIIFSSIIAVSMMLINLIKSMIFVIFKKSYSLFSSGSKFTIDFSRLKTLDYASLILKNLLIYAGTIAAIALVYYLAGLIVKKSVNYIKMLSISATSLVPFVLLSMVISPILGAIWEPLAIVATVVGAVYSLLIFMNLVNEDIKFENVDKKIYFHLICLSILAIAGFYVYMSLLDSTISSGFSNLFDLF